VVSTDRHGIKRSFPLLTISIAITLSERYGTSLFFEHQPEQCKDERAFKETQEQ
jgi:hypothetical protein